jgi:hypothetical protein
LQATETLQNLIEIFSSEVANSSRAVISNIRSTGQISQLINYRRNSITSARNIEIADLGLVSELLTTHRGTSFYQYGPSRYAILPVYSKVAIFFSQEIVDELRNHSIWCIDGTFSVSPSGYTQVFTISTLQNHYAIPIVYSVLKDKSRRTHDKFLEIVGVLIPNLNPSIITCDFEMAEKEAFKNTFPADEIQGCLFHLG